MSNRKAFNFFRSYYEVAKELNEKDRLAFYDALILEQFTGQKTPLKGMAKFSYISQEHSIKSQINGYNQRLNRNDIPEEEKSQKIVVYVSEAGGEADPAAGGEAQEKGQVQVQEKVQEKEKEEIYPTFIDFWNLYDKKIDKDSCESKWSKLSQKEKEQIIEYLPSYIQSTPDKTFRKHPKTFLNNKSWTNELITNNSTQSDISRIGQLEMLNFLQGN